MNRWLAAKLRVLHAVWIQSFLFQLKQQLQNFLSNRQEKAFQLKLDNRL